MADRNISCGSCTTHLGVIRDARLRKDITYHCEGCVNKAAAKIAELEKTIRTMRNADAMRSTGRPAGGFEDIFGDIFGERR